MAKINVLDKYLAELIAAGEVVERPASAIKEMVENAIDAGATAVTVEIHDGGASYIRVQDNGCGIARADVPKAFLRHATSKIARQDDLDAIQTLGFRGEALASICAMARVEMLTRTEEELAGTRYVIEGGTERVCEDIGCPKGTTVVVRDLFFNTPARMKFLKKDVAEGNAVGVVVDHAALSHPEIAFRMIRDGKETLHTAGDGNLKNATTAVFGREFSAGMLQVDYNLGKIRVFGLISRPADARPKRGMQNFFLNGRYIKSNLAAAALEQGYHGTLMTGKFPSCVLHLSVPADAVDVNVHPAKTEVRFITERPIFDAIYRAAAQTLRTQVQPEELRFRQGETDAPEVPQKTYAQVQFAQTAAPTPVGSAKEIVEAMRAGGAFARPQEYDDNVLQPKLKKATQEPPARPKLEITLSESDAEAAPVPLIPSEPIPSPSRPTVSADPRAIAVDVSDTPLTENATAEPEIYPPEPTQTEIAMPAVAEKAPKAPETEEIFTTEPQEPDTLRFVGEAFRTYILLESREELIYIDKHAAHERLIYEKIKKESGKRYAQQLLCPIAVTLDKEEYAALLENEERLREVGFELSDFGAGTLIVRSVPLSFAEEDIQASLIGIATYLMEHRSDLSTKHDDWIAHNIACRAAIKAGDKNNAEELMALAQQLHDHPELRFCPHGRPIYLAVRKRELEKQFGRLG